MDEIQFIESQKGGKLLIHDKYTLRLGHKGKERSLWKCCSRRCGVRITTTNEEYLVRVDGKHDHEPDEEKLKRQIFYNNLKERSRNETSKTVQQIYREEVAKYEGSPDARLRLPTCSAVEVPMYKVRGVQKPLKDKGEVQDLASNKMEFIESNRGGKLLVLNNYLFRGQRNQKTVSRWTCCEEGCPTVASVSLINNQLLRVKGSHNHDSDEKKIYRKKFYNLLKSRITEDPTVASAKLFREELATFATTPEIKASLPSLKLALKVIANLRYQVTKSNDDDTKIPNVHDHSSFNMEFLECSGGGKLLVLNNYLFKSHRRRTKKTSFWGCTEKECPTTAIVSRINNHLLKMKGTHNHDPHTKKICRKKFYNLLKARITQNPKMPPAKVFREELAKFATTPRIKACMPSQKLALKVMTTMRYQESKNNNDDTKMHNEHEIKMEDEYSDEECDTEIKQEPEDEEVLPESEPLFSPVVFIKEEPVTWEEE